MAERPPDDDRRTDPAMEPPGPSEEGGMPAEFVDTDRRRERGREVDGEGMGEGDERGPADPETQRRRDRLRGG